MEKTLVFFIFITTIFGTVSHARSASRLFQSKSGMYGHSVAGKDCLSWRLAVETGNIIKWRSVPVVCEGYISHYMLGGQYRRDCHIVFNSAIEYVESLNLTGDGKDVWVFDIDETTLSNLPYYSRSDIAFGSTMYNNTKFSEWMAEGKDPPVPGSVKLYKKVLSLGIKIVFITGTEETFRDLRAANLKAAGYKTWYKLILRGDSDTSLAVVFKAKERGMLEAAGYRIVGNIGDQWSDISGTNVGMRTFKVPNPVYYIG